MKAALAAAVLGVLAAGGLPAVALTMTADEGATPAASAAPKAAPDAAQWQPGDGAPPWSNGRHTRAAGERAHPHTGQLPPGLAKQGKALHGAQMRAWAHCVAGRQTPTDDASPRSGPAVDPRQECGPKPSPPARTQRDRR